MFYVPACLNILSLFTLISSPLFEVCLLFSKSHTPFFLLQHLPPPNPFIPDDLSLDTSLQHHLDASREGSKESSKEGSEVAISAPVELRSEDGLHVWHLLDLKFPVPKVRSDPT